MSYRVDYRPIRKVRGVPNRTSSVAALTALCFLLFLLLVNHVWPHGAVTLQNLVFSGNAAVTVAALEDLAGELENGEKIADALNNFCSKIIREEEVDPN